jgi:phosphatidylserine/phosphatidylglycerophosphate/cardiolipin synthase-like enzyme
VVTAQWGGNGSLMGIVRQVSSSNEPTGRKQNRKSAGSGKLGILHVKCVVGNGRWLFLSSANLTKYAFSLNMLLGMLKTGGQAPQRIERMFENLISNGVFAAVT